MRAALVPSARTLAIIALMAPFAVLFGALVPAAWAVLPAGAIALLGVMMLDGFLAPRLRDLKLHAPSDAEVGRPLTLTVLAEMSALPATPIEAMIGFDPRLGDGGVARIALHPGNDEGVQTGEAAIVPVRRGTGSLTHIAVRWRGPLGLALRQANRTFDHPVRVWPDISPVRSPALQTFMRDASFGLIARRMRGEGTQFEALSEYQPGMDRRRIDWKASARHTKLYARENETERDNQIVFAFDCGHAMIDPVDGVARLDRAISAALLASYVALKGGDRAALFGFAERPLLLTPFAVDSRSFHRLQTAAASLDYSAREPNFTLALSTLAARLKRRSLIVLFSDFSDLTSAELMIESVERLIRHHLLIFVTFQDTDLDQLTSASPDTLGALAGAVAADALARQRALVLQRLRRLGVDVIEAPWQQVGYRLLDRYLAAKNAQAVG